MGFLPSTVLGTYNIYHDFAEFDLSQVVFLAIASSVLPLLINAYHGCLDCRSCRRLLRSISSKVRPSLVFLPSRFLGVVWNKGQPVIPTCWQPGSSTAKSWHSLWRWVDGSKICFKFSRKLVGSAHVANIANRCTSQNRSPYRSSTNLTFSNVHSLKPCFWGSSIFFSWSAGHTHTGP